MVYLLCITNPKAIYILYEGTKNHAKAETAIHILCTAMGTKAASSQPGL